MKFLLCASYLHVSIFFPLAASQQGTPKLDILLLKTPDKNLQLKHPPDDNKHQEAHLVNDTDQHTVYYYVFESFLKIANLTSDKLQLILHMIDFCDTV